MEELRMKNLINKAKNFRTAMVSRAALAVICASSAGNRAKAALAGNNGEGFVDSAVKILIAVVIGALLLAGLYLLFSATILPTLKERIEAMFNFGG
jgi:hypothetical protein